MISRRLFLSQTLAGVATSAILPAFSTGNVLRADESSELNWYDVQDWGVEGKGWTDTAKYFDRLPAKAEKMVRKPVWNLSRHSAGMVVHFKTDASTIWTHHKVTSPNLAMPHMPATGVSGLDLYAEDDQGEMRWLSVVRPAKQEMKQALISGIIPGERAYSIYLPLYNGTEFLKIGLPKGASMTPIAPREEKPIVFYGTSITHGACASRPGMPHPAILGRRLKKPVLNLGFSGNGKMEPEVGALLCELNPAVYVIDCLPNMVSKEVQERAEPLIKQLRQARPDTPIIMVEDRTYANTPFLKERQERHAGSREAFKKAYQNLLQAGITGLSYLDGEKMLGDDRDDTTDGSHPSDLGFYRQANALEPLLREALSLT